LTCIKAVRRIGRDEMFQLVSIRCRLAIPSLSECSIAAWLGLAGISLAARPAQRQNGAINRGHRATSARIPDA